MTDTAYTVSRTIDARGSFCPGPLMELIRIVRDAKVGDVLAGPPAAVLVPPDVSLALAPRPPARVGAGQRLEGGRRVARFREQRGGMHLHI